MATAVHCKRLPSGQSFWALIARNGNETKFVRPRQRARPGLEDQDHDIIYHLTTTSAVASINNKEAASAIQCFVIRKLKVQDFVVKVFSTSLL